MGDEMTDETAMCGAVTTGAVSSVSPALTHTQTDETEERHLVSFPATQRTTHDDRN